jgi:hypothetical protein
MPIQVTCPGCLSRFSVSDKYAGKKGPCPKCKKEILVPELSQKVVIHAPDTTGPKDSKGVAVLKPIRRKEFVVGWKTWTLVGVSVTAAIATALYLRFSGQPPASLWLYLGALLIAPPVAMFGYTFLRDDELEGYSGREYLIRVAICSVLFAATWLIYFGLSRYFGSKLLAETPVLQMAGFMIGMIAVGAAVSLASLELEVSQSVIHYLGYFLVTFALAWMSGLELAEPLAKPKAGAVVGPTVVPKRVQPTKKKSQPQPQPKKQQSTTTTPASSK